MGNPPYSVGQENDDDGNENIKYPKLEERLKETYIKFATGNPRSLYDSYIKAFRWASDRIKDRGVIAFVSNAGFLEANNSNGMRKCLAEEFSNLYVFHLRGNARTSGERRRKEKDNVFGQGTRTPIAISILVKNPENQAKGQIYFYDIGDYLSQKDKLEIIEELGSIQGISEQKGWQSIVPDSFGDWINQRDPNFDTYINIGEKRDKTAKTVFDNYSSGIKTNRDVWVWNYSSQLLRENLKNTIDFYNKSVEELISKKKPLASEPYKISWSYVLRQRAEKGVQAVYRENIGVGHYRPFSKQYIYYDGVFIENRYQMPRLFPTKDSENLVIYISGVGNSGKSSSALMVNVIPDLNMQHSGGQGFPLYLYEKAEPDTGLFAQEGVEAEYQRRDAITDESMEHFQEAYPELSVSKEDIFYYIYGLLHSEEYREKYADNLSKQLPRIPRVKAAKDFTAFATAGRELVIPPFLIELMGRKSKALLLFKNRWTTIY